MPTSTRTEAGAVRVLGGAFVAVVVLAALGLAFWTGAGPIPDPEGCTASVEGVSVDLSTEQGQNAALIAGIGVQRGLPARAVSIALATAYQESKLVNVDHGDRDSLGLFQQRPSQGWGTIREVQNPRYATNAFYDALEKVDGYESMRITEAAQEVQRSGFPEAYAAHESDARVLASALTGYSPGGRFTCVVHEQEGGLPDRLDRQGLTRATERVRHNLERTFGSLSLGGFAPGGVSTGHVAGSAHYEGRAVDVFVRPVTEANNRRGWAIAQYLVAQAKPLHVDHVIFDDRIWTSGTLSEQGWRDYDPPESSGDPVVLEHRDHVHVDVVD